MFLIGVADLLGECLDGLLALPEEVEQLDPFGARERMADAGELRVEGVLELSVAGHGSEWRRRLTTILMINRISEYRHLSRGTHASTRRTSPFPA